VAKHLALPANNPTSQFAACQTREKNTLPTTEESNCHVEMI
jgi:hypothetical protein